MLRPTFGVPGDNEHSHAYPLGAVALLAVLAAAVAFRVYLLATTGFPLNDGALFYEFVVASAKSFPAIPETVAFNGFEIPFTYPPFSFWFGALLTRLGADPLDVVRLVPIIVNLIYVLLFAWLLLRSGYSRLFAALVLLFFCTRLRSFEWLVMGGGLSRGFGSVFFLLALIPLAPMFGVQRREVSLRAMALAGLAVGGAILSHLEWGILAAAAVLIAVAGIGGTFRTFATRCVVAGVCALVAIAPWLAFALQTHGLDPFLAASRSSRWEAGALLEHLGSLIRIGSTNPFMVLGVFALARRRQLFWVLLLLAAVILTPRHAATAMSLPLSILAATGVFASYTWLGDRFGSKPVALVAVAAAVLALTAVRFYKDGILYGFTVRELSAAERSAMVWVAHNHPGRTFAVVTGAPWAADHVAEWFPTLAKATSVTTAQGAEWLEGDVFDRRKRMTARFKRARNCPRIVSATRAFGSVDFIWSELGRTCFVKAGYVPVFTNNQVSIFEASGRAPPAERTRS